VDFVVAPGAAERTWIHVTAVGGVGTVPIINTTGTRKWDANRDTHEFCAPGNDGAG
jgi:hypothetical protein